MLRRTVAYFVLAVALLFSQHGGLVHELSHLAGGSSQQDKQLPHKACDQCAAYAQVAGGAVSQFWLALPQMASGQISHFQGVAIATPAFLTYPSRAPPAFA